MAKQVGDIIIVGTIDDITFYVMEGQGYARHNSSLTGKRVKKDPRFKRTMQSAHRLGRGSQLASKVYRSLPRQEQVYALFKELKRLAVLAIKEGRSEADVLALLHRRVEKSQAVKKTCDVMVQPVVGCKEERIKKTPRLFRVYGGRLKQASRQGQRGRRLPQPVCPSGTGQRHHQQRE
jgi:hypothetical protein